MTTERITAARTDIMQLTEEEINAVSGGFWAVLAIGAAISLVMFLATGKVNISVRGTF